MANVVHQKVEGIGITSNLENLVLGQYFTEIAIPEIVKLPEAKPDMEQLISVMVDCKVVSVRVIDTPKGLSAEGQILKGKKLSIELELQQKVKYIADEPAQSVHAVHFTKFLSSIFIVVNPIIGNNSVETLITQGRYVLTPYIEDIYGEQIDKRTIFKNITILMEARFLPC